MVLKTFGSTNKNNLDKYERLGFKVSYEHPPGHDIKIIDYTQDYTNAMNLIHGYSYFEHFEDLPEL